MNILKRATKWIHRWVNKGTSPVGEIQVKSEGEEGLLAFLNVLIASYHDATVMKCLVDDSGYLKDCSNSWTKALGWSIKEFQEKPFLEYVHPEDIERTLQAYTSKIYEDQNTWTFDNRYQKKGGGYQWVRWVGPSARINYKDKWFSLGECFCITQEEAHV